LFLAIFSTFYEIENQSLIATITIVAICASRLIPGFQQISTSINVLNNTKFAIKIIKEDIMNFDNVNNHSLPIALNKDFNCLELKNVCFSFQNKNILNNINLRIKEGDKICIIGESGSGKTTLLSIMMGLLEASRGDIEINKKEINQENLLNYQSQIGYVSQDIFISDDTILSNIAIGESKSDIDISRINKVIELSNMGDFINDSSKKLSSRVGTKGVKLSGGQIQRIGIARALYRDPKIIFFDEATSSLDEKNETIILENIFRAFNKRTIVFVTHKKQLVRYFDKVIKVDNGRVTTL
jgi:ABC-type bacteriocin/lantibiotic exporter with double-glycine peptidase domain